MCVSTRGRIKPTHPTPHDFPSGFDHSSQPGSTPSHYRLSAGLSLRYDRPVPRGRPTVRVKSLARPSVASCINLQSSPLLRTRAAERGDPFQEERRLSMSLPDHPDLNWLRKQAKRLLKELREVNPAATAGGLRSSTWRSGTDFRAGAHSKAHVDSVTVRTTSDRRLGTSGTVDACGQSGGTPFTSRCVDKHSIGGRELVLDRGIAAAAALREPDRSGHSWRGPSRSPRRSHPPVAIRLAPMVPMTDSAVPQCRRCSST
jgi:hypothetical protein